MRSAMLKNNRNIECLAARCDAAPARITPKYHHTRAVAFQQSLFFYGQRQLRLTDTEAAYHQDFASLYQVFAQAWGQYQKAQPSHPCNNQASHLRP